MALGVMRTPGAVPPGGPGGGVDKKLRSAPTRTREGGRRRRSASGLHPEPRGPEGFAVKNGVRVAPSPIRGVGARAGAGSSAGNVIRFQCGSWGNPGARYTPAYNIARFACR